MLECKGISDQLLLLTSCSYDITFRWQKLMKSKTLSHEILCKVENLVKLELRLKSDLVLLLLQIFEFLCGERNCFIISFFSNHFSSAFHPSRDTNPEIKTT